MPSLSWKKFFNSVKESYFGIKKVSHSSGPSQEISRFNAFFVNTFGGFYKDKVLEDQRRIYIIEGGRASKMQERVEEGLKRKKNLFNEYKKLVSEALGNADKLEQLAFSIYEEDSKLQGEDESEIVIAIKNYLHELVIHELFPLNHSKVFYKHPGTVYATMMLSQSHHAVFPPPTYSMAAGWLRFLHPCNLIDALVGSPCGFMARGWSALINKLFCSCKNSLLGHIFKLPATIGFGIKTLTYGVALMTNSCDGCAEMGNFCKGMQQDMKIHPVWVPSQKNLNALKENKVIHRKIKPAALRKSKTTREINELIHPKRDNSPVKELKKSRFSKSHKPSNESKKDSLSLRRGSKTHRLVTSHSLKILPSAVPYEMTPVQAINDKKEFKHSKRVSSTKHIKHFSTVSNPTHHSSDSKKDENAQSNQCVINIASPMLSAK